MYDTIQEDDAQGYFSYEEARIGMMEGRYDDKARIDFKKAVMDQQEEAHNEDLETIQRCIENEAKKIAHTA